MGCVNFSGGIEQTVFSSRRSQLSLGDVVIGNHSGDAAELLQLNLGDRLLWEAGATLKGRPGL